MTSTAPGLLPSQPEWTPARRRLYEAALSLFGERGYHAVSVRDVARALGQQPGALYGHVESKEHLLAELVGVGLRALYDAISRAVAEAPPDPVSQLRALVEAHVRLHAELPALARVVNQEFHSLGAARQAEMHTLRMQSAEVLLGVITRGVETGDFRSEEPVLAMRAIAAMGVRVSDWIGDEPVFDVARVAEVFADMSVAMLMA